MEPAAEDGIDPASATTLDSPPTIGDGGLYKLADEAPLPTHLGRYVVIEQIGRGGMGRVLRAYDPKLRREVALKLVGGDVPDSEGRTRIVREAQAMAQLSHPNIVPVYDVEYQGDGIYIAMEYVRGDTLATWLARESREWRQVLLRFLDAGRGLSAAHAAGMVHRDFKPSNVMIGADDRVRVMDFGLVRTSDPVVSPSDAGVPGDLRTSSPELFGLDASGDQTGAGVVMGTLHYMAPEQHRGAAVGPAADQYAFCVALYEGLFGVRPFSGEDARALLRAKERGVSAKRVPVGSVPAWLRTAVLRGLEPTPAARWPSMQALLAALQHGRTRARQRRVVAAFVGLTAVATAVFGAREISRRRTLASCEHEGRVIYKRWDGPSRAALRAGLVATEVSYAEDTADKLMPWLDSHADAWAQATTEACVRSHVRADWDADTLERAEWCLAERRMAHEALVDELSDPDPAGVRGAISAAAGLASAAACLDGERLSRAPAPPATEIRAAIDIVRNELSRSAALRAAGRYDDAMSSATAALERARELQWPPLVASAQLSVGIATGHAGRHNDEELELEKAYFAAHEVGEPELAAAAGIALTNCVGWWLARKRDGLRWAQLAQLELRAGGDSEGLLQARLDTFLGATLLRAGDYAEAKARYQDALTLREQVLGPDHPDVAIALGGLANVERTLGHYDEAKALHERALVIAEAALGPQHPEVAAILNNLANTLHDRGAVAEARVIYERALAIRTQALGPDHLEVASTLNNLALTYDTLGDAERAAASYEQALATLERGLGPEHPDVAAILNNFAMALRANGKHDDAKRLITRALQIQEKRLGPNHAEVAMFSNNLGLILAAGGSHAEAKRLFERTLMILEENLGPNHPEVVLVLNNLADANRRIGAPAEAERLYLRALSIVEGRDDPANRELDVTLVGLAGIALDDRRPGDATSLARRAMQVRLELGAAPPQVADAQWLLARAQWDAGGDRNAARELARQATETFATAGDEFAGPLAEARAWLAAHAQP